MKMPNNEFKKNAKPDIPDLRDWIYQPALIQLKASLDPPRNLHVLHQESEGACTGFALAAVINVLLRREVKDTEVSPRMLYEMAKLHDKWPGEDYEGSSLRGAIHGWKNMGVCRESYWPYKVDSPGKITIRRAKDARSQTIGAYYRLKPQITDFHSALNEVEAIAVSAQVHDGWDNPVNGKIEFRKTGEGGHAFAVVGYNDKGFWVQNSWGEDWGDGGLALWSYEDWVENVMDAWVFRLAVPTPQIFGKQTRLTIHSHDESGKSSKKSVARAEIAGHFVHVDDGKFKDSDNYWSTFDDIDQTAERLAASDKYKHLLIYAHGGLNAPKQSAGRIAALKDTFKSNGIYPFHIMYDTGLAEELKDLINRKHETGLEMVGGIPDWTDPFLERLLSQPGRMLWEEMKKDAKVSFAASGAGKKSVKCLLDHLDGRQDKIKLHLAGHSTGGVVLAHLLEAFEDRKMEVETCSLMAPACTVELFLKLFLPVLSGETEITLKDLTIYNLNKSLELDDTVAAYRKSLLWLVSNSFERKKGTPLLGMEEYQAEVKPLFDTLQFRISDGTNEGNKTKSKSHGGFDNDETTMNNILFRILGGPPVHSFDKQTLDY
ncbi:C1 family peptidase [bacterium]|nr:C1 family peptidase [bacterium]